MDSPVVTVRGVRARLPQRGQLLLAAVRALPIAVRQALFQELASDKLLRAEFEAALVVTARKQKAVGKAERARARVEHEHIGNPLDRARTAATETAERIAAVSYPLMVEASARLVAFSGWMANNYVKHGTAPRPRQAEPRRKAT